MTYLIHALFYILTAAEDIDNIICKMSKNSVLGSDELPAELFKAAEYGLIRGKQLVAQIWNKEGIPEEWIEENV